jgi:hypothetical protein
MKSKSKFSIALLFLIGNLNFTFSQYLQSSGMFELPKVKSTKSGPYFGYQRGKYDVFELGGEIQFKKEKLKNPITNAYSFGTNYNFSENVLGFDARYWYQHARLGLTYGLFLSHRTNFNESRFGIAPAIGFRMLQFHVQTGYTLYTPSQTFEELNTFFIALKFTLINKRDYDVDRKKKKGNSGGIFNKKEPEKNSIFKKKEPEKKSIFKKKEPEKKSIFKKKEPVKKNIFGQEKKK